MPPLKLVLGPLPQLEEALCDAIREARRADPLGRVTVVVGSVLLRPYLTRALALRGVPLLNVHILTAQGLASSLAPTSEKPSLGRDAERLVVREVAAGAQGYFSQVAGRQGFADALGRLFRDIDLGGFSAEGFEGAGRALDAREKASELSRLYARFVERRQAFTSPVDVYRSDRATMPGGPLLVYGVWTPRELQARLIERIEAASGATIFLPSRAGESEVAHEAFRARLTAAGAETVELSPADEAGAQIAAVARSLFAEPAAPIEGDAVELVSAPDPLREVCEAARACLRWAAEGIAFHEMAVVYRHADTYRAIIDEVFAEADIEAYLHDGRPVAEHPRGRRLLALLDLAADPAFPRAGVMEFVAETEVSHAVREAHGFTPAEWDTFSREAGIVGGIDQWLERLEKLAADKRDEAAREEGREWLAERALRVDALRAFIAELHSALSGRAADATWAEHLDYLRTLAEAYATGTREIVEALADVKALAAVTPVCSFETFCFAVREDLERRDETHVFGQPERKFGRRGVAVVDAVSFRQLRFRAVWLLGAGERAWPPPRRPDPLLLEDERARLNAAGAGTLPLRTEPDDEELTFRLAVQGARERLAVSYARSDTNSRTKQHVPSHFFLAVASALDGRRHSLQTVAACGRYRRVAAGRLSHADPDASLSLAEYDRAIAAADGAPDGVRALATLAPSITRAVAARRARWSRSVTEYDGALAGAEALARAASTSPFSPDQVLSPSRLETYAVCPYRFFMKHVLRVEPIEDPEDLLRIDNLERGSLIHGILEEFLREIRAEAPSAEARERHLARLMEVAARQEAEREARGVTGLKLAWTLDKRQINEDLERWYDYEVREAARSDLRPGAFEVAFGGGGYEPTKDDSGLSTDEPLTLRAGDGDLRFRGRIDRIDWNEGQTCFRVIDYKTGKYDVPPRPRSGAIDPYKGGEKVQLPIYLEAAAKALGLDPAQGEARYSFVSSRGGFRSWPPEGDTWQTTHGRFESLLGAAATGIETGAFAPLPERQSKCRFCDYRGVCDTSIETIMARKTGARPDVEERDD